MSSMIQFILRMFQMMGINWQLVTHLAALDALLVTKRTKILSEAVTHPHSHFKIGRAVAVSVPNLFIKSLIPQTLKVIHHPSNKHWM